MSDILTHTTATIAPGRAYRLARGIVTPSRDVFLPPEGSRLPGHGTGIHLDDPENDERWAMPAADVHDAECPHFASWTAPVAAELLNRLMPTAVCYAAPRFKNDCRPTNFGKSVPFGGTAIMYSGVMLATSSCGPTGFLSVVLHETLHLIDPYFTDAEREIIDQELSAEHATLWPGHYLDSMLERRANGFLAWLNHLVHGGRHQYHVDDRDMAWVWGRIWNGEIGKEIAAGLRPWRQVPAG